MKLIPNTTLEPTAVVPSVEGYDQIVTCELCCRGSALRG
jgi:hypothetical protein